MRTRGISKDTIMLMGLNLAKEFEQAFYWKDEIKYNELKGRLLKFEKLVEKRMTLVK